jgi:beta-N-acetylhexosaminidase
VSDQLRRWADGVLLPGYSGAQPPQWVLRRLGTGLAGVVLYHGNVVDEEQLAKATAAIAAEHPRALIGIDEEGGDVTRLETAAGSSWPGNLALGAADDLDLTRSVARQVGLTLASVGVRLDLAPTADVNLDPVNPVIGVRSFGDRAAHVAAHTGAWIDGLQSAGVAGCAKHFPGHGNTGVDSHHALPVVLDDEEALRRTALPPFRAAIEAGVVAMMTAHVIFTALDDQPATLSRRVLTDLLRGELGFDGMLVTDSLEMAAIADGHGIVEGGVRALAAGADALCLGAEDGEAGTRALRDAIVEAVRQGSLAEERLAQAADRVEAAATWMELRKTAEVEEPDRALGMRAARGAVVAHGRTLLTAAPLVLELADTPNPAVGATAWGLGGLLAEHLPGTVTRRIRPGATARVLACLPSDRTPVVLAVRGRHQHPWIRDCVTAVVARRPGAIVVEMGFPTPGSATLPHEVITHGASHASAIAAVEVLIGRTLPLASASDRG